VRIDCAQKEAAVSTAETLDALPRLSLCQLPTPMQRLDRLEEALGVADGPQLWIKRDDLTGLGLGGNKGRKLEFCLAEARRQNADVVITSGGVQSNHARQTAVAATALGFEVHLFLKGKRPERFTGNLLPSQLCGAQFHFIDSKDVYGDTPPVAAFVEQLRGAGRRTYVIPGGASNNTGAMGYVNAAREIRTQEQQLGQAFDWVFHATGSTGTQAGLLAGAQLFGLTAKVVGVAVGVVQDPEGRREGIARFANSVLAQLGSDRSVAVEQVALLCDYAGEGYAIPTPGGREAVDLLARLAGIFLDYTYTGKAMAALIDWVRTGRFRREDRVLFIHTGGQVALFA
jgi:L-cysteate sulfo-lyase